MESYLLMYFLIEQYIKKYYLNNRVCIALRREVSCTSVLQCARALRVTMKIIYFYSIIIRFSLQCRSDIHNLTRGQMTSESRIPSGQKDWLHSNYHILVVTRDLGPRCCYMTLLVNNKIIIYQCQSMSDGSMNFIIIYQAIILDKKVAYVISNILKSFLSMLCTF